MPLAGRASEEPADALRIQWTRLASEQLEVAFRFLSEENLPAAETQLEIIARAVEQLANFPEMGRLCRVDGTRELVIQGTPYIVAYRSKRSIVRILALLHGARRWPTNL